MVHLNPKPGRHGGGGDPMLTGAGFGDNPGLSHAPDQQALTHDVVGLVGAGVVQVLPFDVDVGPAEVAGQVFRKRQGASAGRNRMDMTSAVFPPEGRVAFGFLNVSFKFVESRHQDFGKKSTAESVHSSPAYSSVSPPMVWEKTN